MAIVRRDPASEVRSLSRQMEQLFETLSPRASRGRETTPAAMMEAWPAIDVYEDKDEIVVRADVPGVEPKDLDVLLEDSTLTVRGQRRLQRDERRENYRRIETVYGTFTRSFTLPPTIDRDKVRAELREGLLEVHVPKREGAKGKAIPIHT